MIAQGCEIRDEQDFEYFYGQNGRNLASFLVRRGIRGADAEDLSQEVWMKIWKNRNRFDGRDFTAWMFRITRNSIVDAARKSMLLNKLVEQKANSMSDSRREEPTSLERLIREEEILLAKNCLKQNNCFFNVLQAQLDGEPVSATAKRMGISEKTVYSRRNRAKKLLAKKLVRQLQPEKSS